MERLGLRILGTERLGLRVQAGSPTLHLRIGEGHSVDWYAGPYDATPTRSEQHLPTRGKTMRSDVTVHEIPYYQTANPYGTTFVIGE